MKFRKFKWQESQQISTWGENENVGVWSCFATGIRSDSCSLLHLSFVSNIVFIIETEFEIKENVTSVLIDHSKATQMM